MSKSDSLAVEPAIIVIFGVTGDLSKRYLLPSLYHLVKMDMLHPKTEIIGVTRGKMTIDELLSTIELCVNEVDGICDPVAVKKLRGRLRIRNMDLADGAEYVTLLKDLNDIEDGHDTHMNRLYYLSVPPNVSSSITTLLGQNGLNARCQHKVAQTRLLMEKPFGHDTQSAQDLIVATSKQFDEDQVFRIDHYLAKETVQNILAFRFNNPIFEPIWNARHISYIEVLADEKLGIEGRVNFYDKVGALRDLIQSHLFQILALITMEQPEELSSDDVHQGKLNLMKQIIAPQPADVSSTALRGQYSTYREEVGNPDSITETFAAVQLRVDNKRWENTPMIIKTGKALKERLSEVNVVFKPTDDSPHHNVLTFRIQPNEAIELSLRVKRPGFDDEIQPVEMEFDYKSTLRGGLAPSAYERVLMDALRGDHTLFTNAEEVMESWRVMQPIIDEWVKNGNDLELYETGTNGPDISKLYP